MNHELKTLLLVPGTSKTTQDHGLGRDLDLEKQLLIQLSFPSSLVPLSCISFSTATISLFLKWLRKWESYWGCRARYVSIKYKLRKRCGLFNIFILLPN